MDTSIIGRHGHRRILYQRDGRSTPHIKWYKIQKSNIENTLHNKEKADNFNEIQEDYHWTNNISTTRK